MLDSRCSQGVVGGDLPSVAIAVDDIPLPAATPLINFQDRKNRKESGLPSGRD